MRGVLLVLLLLVPGSQALTIVFEPSPPLEPGTATAASLAVSIPCEDLLSAPTATPLLDIAIASPHESLEIQAPAPVAIERQACAPGDEIAVPAPYMLLAQMALPAEEPHAYVVTARLRDTEHTASAQATTEAVYVGAFAAVAERTHAEAGPQKQIAYAVHIENRGNAISQYTFQLVDADFEGQAVAPATIFLEPGQSIAADVVYLTPFENGHNEMTESFAVRITSRSAERDTPGQEQVIEFGADTKGWYVPGPAAWLALAGAFALRQRRPAP